MAQLKFRAVFMRGGTSRAVIFRRMDLPADSRKWDPIFLAAIGSPDPYGRQLDGMGGGISSLSKVAVIGEPSRTDADVDYTFGQVAVGEPVVDYRANCGNISSAVGPFAVDEGIVRATGTEAIVRIHNTNTKKLIVARFPVEDSHAEVEGDFELQGVAGRGARIQLKFLDPGGAGTGQLLPTGRVIDRLEVPGWGTIEASLVDATNPAVFVEAAAVGLTATEEPTALERDPAVLGRLEAIRGAAAVRMGLAATPEEATRRSPGVPKIAVVAPPRPATTLAGTRLDPEAMDLTVRMLSMGQPHRVVPLTGAMCLAVAVRIEGTIPNVLARRTPNEADVRLAHPSGILPLAAAVRSDAGAWVADHVVVYRTARKLMEGAVLVPFGRLGAR